MGNVFVKPGGGGADLDVVTAAPADVLAGKVIVGADGEPAAGTMPERGAWSGSVGMNSSIAIPGGHHNGGGQVSGPSVTQRGAWGTSLGINGSVAVPEGYHNGSGRITQSIPTFGGQTISPSAGQQIAYCAGKYATGNVTVSGVSNLAAANIKKGVTVGGVTGTFEGYVPTATDLYLRGNNIAGFVKVRNGGGGVVFEEGMITAKYDSHTGVPASICTSRQYSLTGFSKINLECDVTYLSGGMTVYLYRGQTTGAIFASGSTTVKGNQIISVSFSNKNINDYWCLSLGSAYVNIYRIWLS